MDVPVPFKPFTKQQYLSIGEVRRRSERATAAAVSGLLASSEYEQWTRQKSRRRVAAWAMASHLLGLLIGWLATAPGGRPAQSVAIPSDLFHVVDMLRTAPAAEDAIAAAIEHISGLNQEAVTLRSQASTQLETSRKLSSRMAAAEASSAEHERTARKRQRELQDCRASASFAQQRHSVMEEQLGVCAAEVAQSVQASRAAVGAGRSAARAASEQVEALTTAMFAQADCAPHLLASQGEAEQCFANLTLSEQRSVEYSLRSTACEAKFIKVSEELDYALSDSEALIARSGVASLRAVLVIAAGLALAVLLTAGYIHVLKRRVVSLQLEREKLLLDKVEAEAGIRSLRGRSMRTESGRLHD